MRISLDLERHCLVLTIAILLMFAVSPLSAQPDLAVKSVAVMTTTTDWQTLEYTGDVFIGVTNIGFAPSGATCTLTAFEDVDLDGILDPMADTILGTTTVSDLLPGSDESVSIPVAAPPLFRQSPVLVYIDSGSVIAESNESNNYGRTGGDCQSAPIYDYLWTIALTKDTFINEPAFDQVMSTPIVIDLDLDGSPEIVFPCLTGIHSPRSSPRPGAAIGSSASSMTARSSGSEMSSPRREACGNSGRL